MLETPPQLIVIGTSAGGLDALTAILSGLPKEYSLPILIVIHLPPNKNSLMVELFQQRCQLSVKEAEDKEPLQPGIYFAPPDYHLLVENDFRLSLSSDEPVRYSRPSIDVLFESAAEFHGAAVLGIVLTGANDDGARGAQQIENAGGTVLVQSPNEAHSPEMPQGAINRCAHARVMSLTELAAALREVGQ